MPRASVQSGTLSWTDNTGYTKSVTLATTIDLTKAFLVYTLRTINNSGSTQFAGHITGYINSTTELVFVRQFETTEDWAIDWFVVSFDSGIYVERGSSDVGTSTVNVTLAHTFDTDKTWAIQNSYQPSNGYDPPQQKTSVKCDLTTGTNLALISYENSAKPKLYWQVVQYDCCRVQKVSKSFTTETSGTNTLLIAVPMDKTFVHLTGRHEYSDFGGSDFFDVCWHCRLTATDTLTYERVTSESKPAEFVSYVVTFTDGARVQHNKTAITVDTIETNVLPSPVIGNTNMAWIVGGSHYNHTAMDPASTSSQQWRVSIGARITAYNNVRLERAIGCVGGIPAGNFYWELVEHVGDTGLFSLILASKGKQGAS